MESQFFLPVIWGLAGTKRGVPQRSQYSMRKEYRKCRMKTKGHDPHSSSHLTTTRQSPAPLPQAFSCTPTFHISYAVRLPPLLNLLWHS